MLEAWLTVSVAYMRELLAQPTKASAWAIIQKPVNPKIFLKSQLIHKPFRNCGQSLAMNMDIWVPIERDTLVAQKYYHQQRAIIYFTARASLALLRGSLN